MHRRIFNPQIWNKETRNWFLGLKQEERDELRKLTKFGKLSAIKYDKIKKK